MITNTFKANQNSSKNTLNHSAMTLFKGTLRLGSVELVYKRRL